MEAKREQVFVGFFVVVAVALLIARYSRFRRICWPGAPFSACSATRRDSSVAPRCVTKAGRKSAVSKVQN